MDWVVVMLHIDRSGIQQIFGPYGTEALANNAMDGLKGWPTLRGEWEVRPLTRRGDITPPAPPTVPLPALPYVPPHTHPAPYVNPNLWPSPVWPYQDRIVWCETNAESVTTYALTLTPEARARMTACSGAGMPLSTFTMTLGGPEPRTGDGDDGTAGVPARV